MPRNSIRNLGQPAGGAPPDPQTRGSAPAPDLPPELQTLLREREALERQMQTLTGGTATGSSDPADRRYPITSMAERRADDNAWMARRDQRPGNTAEPDPMQRLSQLQAAGRPLIDLMQDPPERTGQRALRGLQDRVMPNRTSLRQLPEAGRALMDVADRGQDRLDRPTNRLSEERPLPNDPKTRDLTPRIPVPEVPALRSLDDRMKNARKRLDVLEGGSGNLDKLRDLARQRMFDRRSETKRDEKRDAARMNRRQDDDTARPRRKQTNDDKRDAARLDRRGSGRTQE